MLILTVKEGASVKIGNSEVKVVLVRGNHVRLGFKFPKDVKILRDNIDDDDVVGMQKECGGRRERTNIRSWKSEST